jgi:hypothetical protein
MTEEAKGGVSEETFDDFLLKLGMLEDAEITALKRILAWQYENDEHPTGLS